MCHGSPVFGPVVTRRLATTLLGTFAPWALACSFLESPEQAPVPEAKFKVALHVSKATEGGLGNVQVARNKRVIATTNADGNVTLSLSGTEGDRVELTIVCPDPYESPEKPLVVGLRHLAPGSAPPQFDATCIRSFHTVAIGIRAGNGRDLPIIRLGQVVGTTDHDGIAHLSIEAPPNEQVSIKLDTSARPRLRPQSPSLTFVTSGRDELVLLEQQFVELREKVRAKPAPQRPTRL